jgi:energy-converting hydrogenase A subunit M
LTSKQEVSGEMTHPLETEVQEFLQYLEEKEDCDELESIKAICESYAYLIKLVQDENMTVERLQEIVFGSADQAHGAFGTRSEGARDAAQRRALRRRHRRLIGSKRRRALW